MRNKQALDQSIKAIFEQYQAEFGGDGFADNDIPQIMKRTISRKKVEFLDKSIDALNLSKEELENYEKELNEDNLKKAEQTFHDFLEQKNYRMAEYQINNYRKVWPLEKRREMAKLIGEDYDINPETDTVDTKHNIKKALKKAKRDVAS